MTNSDQGDVQSRDALVAKMWGFAGCLVGAAALMLCFSHRWDMRILTVLVMAAGLVVSTLLSRRKVVVARITYVAAATTLVGIAIVELVRGSGGAVAIAPVAFLAVGSRIWRQTDSAPSQKTSR